MAWDKDKPAGSTKLNAADDEIRANNAAIEATIAKDHDFITGSTQSGEHKRVTFKGVITDPADLASGEAALYIKALGAGLGLYFLEYGGAAKKIPIPRVSRLKLIGTSSTHANASLASVYNGDTVGTTDIYVGYSGTNFVCTAYDRLLIKNAAIAGTITDVLGIFRNGVPGGLNELDWVASVSDSDMLVLSSLISTPNLFNALWVSTYKTMILDIMYLAG